MDRLAIKPDISVKEAETYFVRIQRDFYNFRVASRKNKSPSGNLKPEYEEEFTTICENYDRLTLTKPILQAQAEDSKERRLLEAVLDLGDKLNDFASEFRLPKLEDIK